MFRNYLVTALRNLQRNWLYAAISILGLGVALAAAILIALFVRNEFNYDRWIPGYQSVYKLTDTLTRPGQPPGPSDVTQSVLASQIKLALPGITAARLMQDFPTIHRQPGDEGFVDQSFAWADPDIFKVLPLPVLAGDLKSSLNEPDSVVMTRQVARKYFGRDAPIGAMLDVQQGDQHHYMHVTAVLKDYPSNTTLVAEIIGSGQSAYSPLSQMDAGPPRYGNVSTFTFVRLPPKISAAQLRRGLKDAQGPEASVFKAGGGDFSFDALPLADIHLTAPGLTETVIKPVGSKVTALAIATVGLMIVLVAGINFVTLLTARATRRAVEVGIRKVAGAKRRDLVIQFMGEALLQAIFSMIIAMVLAAVLLKPFSAFVQRGLSLNFLADPALAGGLLAATLAIGLLGGLYPALVLSSFRPASVLKGGLVQTAGSARARQGLVVLQFVILIGLILTTITIYRQTEFALNRGIGAKRDLIVAVRNSCRNAFPDQIRALPGVAAAACTTQNALNWPNAKLITAVRTTDGRTVSFDVAPVDFGFFELFDVKPLAGRLFDRSHAGDGPPAAGEQGALFQDGPPASPPVIINATAARDLGYKTPAAAIGQQFPQVDGGSNEIIGVIPDMPGNISAAAEPTFYQVSQVPLLVVKLTGKDMPATIRAIDKTWREAGNTRPIQEVFFAQFEQIQYLDIIIQSVTIAIAAIAAVVIAGLGLFALSAYTTERRTKEIGIRKVMGASTLDIVKLLLWQFTIPVLWAIVIALPIGWLVMNHWLQGYAYHVDLSLWTFVAAAVTALLIAWLTVSFQSYMVAKAKPVLALRYE